jgi:hypothetical protein
MGKKSKGSCPYEPQDPTPEEIAEVFRNLPDWKSDSWAQSPPVSSPVAQRDEHGNKGPLNEIVERSTGAGT